MNLFNLFIASFISISFVFLFGLSWIFYLTNNIYITLSYGLFPFIITDFIKIIASSLIIKSLYNFKK
ncbi:MAG: biotin transporter BioY [bacterium]